MSVEINVPEARIGAVMSDVSSARRGTVDKFDVLQDDVDGSIPSTELMAIVEASVPLAELLGCVLMSVIDKKETSNNM